MLKVALFAILAIVLNSCHPVDDANKLYASLLPGGESMFDVINGEVPQKFHIYRDGPDGLLFTVDRRKADGEIIYNYNKRSYRLHALKIGFTVEAACLEIIYEPYDKTVTPTNIMITTTLSEKVDLAGAHGVTLDFITVDMIQFLIGDKNPREKSTVFKVGWIMDYIKQKRPMFLDIRRGPATLLFVGPPILINADVFAKLRELKDKMKSTLADTLLTMVGSGRSQSGSGSNVPSRLHSSLSSARIELAPTEASASSSAQLDAEKGSAEKEAAAKEELPKEDTAKEELPIEDTAKEELPKEDTAKEELPKEDTPKEELPKEEPQKAEPPKEEPPKEETPKAEPPKEEQPKEEPPKEAADNKLLAKKTQ